MTTLQQLASAQASAEIPVNENFETVSAVGIFGKRHATTSGLIWGYYGGRYNSNTIADGTITLTDAAINYVVVLRSTGVVSFLTTTTNWSDPLYARLYQLTTAGGAVTAVVDERMGTNGLLLGGGGGAGVTDGDKGDITVSGSGATWTVDPNAITYSKLPDVAPQRVIGRNTGAAGDPEEVTLTQLLDWIGSVAQGDIIYRGASAWARLGPGTSGQVLQTQGAAANPQWYTPPGSTQGRHAIYIAAGSMRPSVTGGCASLVSIASAANQPDITSLDFDPTTQEYVQVGVVMPKSWNEGTVSARSHWSHAATTTNFGVVFDIQAVAVSDDDPIAVAFGTAQTMTDAGGTTNDLYTSPESAAMTIAGTPAAEDMVFFRVSRVTGNGSDTMAIDARLEGITLYITTDADTDA